MTQLGEILTQFWKSKYESNANFKRQIDKIEIEILSLLMDLVPMNPYPETIFIEPTDEQYRLFHELLQQQGLTLDKFSGAIGRVTWDVFARQLEDKITILGKTI